MSNARRLAVMAHFDHRGEVAPHVRRHAAALADAVDELVVVSTADLSAASRRFLESVGRLVVRPNYGYDFYSYRTGLRSVADLGRFDEVVVCNDSFVGPLRSYDQVFGAMESRPVDFWGFAGCLRIAPHLQSYFVAFRPWVVASRAFEDFWGGMAPLSDRIQVIHRYEVGMTTRLAEAGFGWGAYFTEEEEDRRAARRRMAWWHAHWPDARAWPAPRDVLAARSETDWNPALALADRALDDARMPMVKIDTLRYDPMVLNADRLLALGERRHPEAFAGVRDYLAETGALYGARHRELRPTPAALRPLRPLVEYRDAS